MSGTYTGNWKERDWQVDDIVHLETIAGEHFYGRLAGVASVLGQPDMGTFTITPGFGPDASFTRHQILRLTRLVPEQARTGIIGGVESTLERVDDLERTAATHRDTIAGMTERLDEHNRQVKDMHKTDVDLSARIANLSGWIGTLQERLVVLEKPMPATSPTPDTQPELQRRITVLEDRLARYERAASSARPTPTTRQMERWIDEVQERVEALEQQAASHGQAGGIASGRIAALGDRVIQLEKTVGMMEAPRST